MTKISFLLVSLLCSLSALAQSEISIVYSGNTANVTIPEYITDVVCTSGNSSNVKITSTTSTNEYIYKVSGSTDDGSLYISGSYKLTLDLAGVDLRSKTGYAVDVECGKRIAVLLDEGTVNNLEDAPNGTHKGTFYFKGHPEFDGGGILNITAHTKHAIYAKEYVQFKRSMGTVNVLSANGDAIHCNDKGQNADNYFQMNGGVLNIVDVTGDCIDTGTFGCANIIGGSISMTVSATDTKGIKAEGDVVMTGGSININVDGDDCDGITTKGLIALRGGTVEMVVRGNGSKGLKSSRALGAEDGGNISIEGTDITIYANGGNYTVGDETTKCRAIDADGNLCHTSGEVRIYAYGPETGTCSIDGTSEVDANTFIIRRAPWQFLPYDYQYDMTSCVSLIINKVAVSDMSNMAVGAFIGGKCVGVALDNYLRIYSPNADREPVIFKAYDYEQKREYMLKAEPQVSFEPNAMAGTYQTPVLLTNTLPGDVNEDGKISIADLAGIMSFVSGGNTDGLNETNADVNQDGLINLEDADIILGILMEE